MSLTCNSDVILFGGIPRAHRARALGPYRIRTVVEEQGLNASLIDYFWDQPFDQIIRHIEYCIGPNTVLFGISYTWVIDIMRENINYNIDRTEYKKRNGYSTTDELLIQILIWLKTNYPNIKTLLGSASAANINRQLLQKIDWVIDGFAELSLPALINHIRHNQDIIYSVREDVKYIDSNKHYKVNDMNILNVKYKTHDGYGAHQPLTLETCRGCLWNCAYCRFAFRGKKDYEYIRSVDHMAQELQSNYEMFGTTRYMIVDDTFNDSEEKIVRLLRAVEKAKLPDFKYICYLRPEMLVSRPNMMPLLIDLGLSGAHVGLESMNDQSRRLVGRGGSFENLKEQICLLKQRSKNFVGVMGTFIIGLPYDSTDDIRSWNNRLCDEQGQFLDQWFWYPLQMNPANIGERIQFGDEVISSDSNQSLIEKNPGKYGYIIDYNKSKDRYAWWSNKLMNFDQAGELATELFAKNKLYNGLGGWSVAFGWYFNLTDQEIASKKLFDCNFESLGSEECSLRFDYWTSVVNNKI